MWFLSFTSYHKTEWRVGSLYFLYSFLIICELCNKGVLRYPSLRKVLYGSFPLRANTERSGGKDYFILPLNCFLLPANSRVSRSFNILPYVKSYVALLLYKLIQNRMAGRISSKFLNLLRPPNGRVSESFSILPYVISYAVP